MRCLLDELHGKIRLSQLICLSACFEDVLTDDLAEFEFCHIICVHTSWIYYFFFSGIQVYMVIKWTFHFCSQEYKLFTRKVSVMSFNCCSFGVAVYFFFRHNWYCEAGSILFRSKLSEKAKFE